MPKLPPNKLPQYRLHRASGQATVTLNGKDFYLGPHGTRASKSRYDQVIAEWISNNRQLPEEAVSIAELVSAYLDFADSYYRQDGIPTKEVDNIEDSTRELLSLYSYEPADEFSPRQLKTVREKMIQLGLSRKYINNRINRIRRIFKWGVENEMIPSEVLHSLQAVTPLKRGRSEARETEPIKPVADEHIKGVLPFMNRQIAAMVKLQRLTGMRSGEVVLVRACDIEMSNKVWLYRPSKHKTQHHGHARVVEIGPRAQEVIKPFLKTDVEAYLFSPIDADMERKELLRKNRKTKVQPSQQKRKKRTPKRKPGSHYTSSSYYRAIQKALNKYNEIANQSGKTPIPHWHPHQIRHTFATEIRKVYGIEIAKLLLGHHSLDVTQIYAEEDRQRVADLVLKIG